MREDPTEVSARVAAEEYEQCLQDARAELAKTLRKDIADALSVHAGWFLESRDFGVDDREFYDGRRMNQTWVVLDKEINMLATLTPVATAIAGIAGPASATITLLSAVAGLAYAFRKKRVELSERDFTLLMFLKDRGPLREHDVLAGLNEIRTTTQFTWKADGLQKDLERLQKVTLRDGTVEALVAQAGDGRWSANGI